MARQLKAAVRGLDNCSMLQCRLHVGVIAAKGFEQDWPFHIQIWPMQRGSNKMKYLASVEQLTQVFLVDVMPEDAAESLRRVIIRSNQICGHVQLCTRTLKMSGTK